MLFWAIELHLLLHQELQKTRGFKMAHEPKELGQEDGKQTASDGVGNFNKEIKRAIDDLMLQKRANDTAKEMYKESLAAIASKVGIKPADLSRRVDLIIKEEESGGVVKSKENDIAFVEKYFAAKDGFTDGSAEN